MPAKHIHITTRLAGRVGAMTGGGFAAAALWAGAIGAAPTPPQSAQYACFPTCVVDGRFLVVTGNDPTTLAASTVVIGLRFPAAGGSGRGNFDLYDGDRDSIRWDVKLSSKAAPPQLEIELYADPLGTGTTTALVKHWAAGEISFRDSDWAGVTWPHAVEALSAPGPDQGYRYSLKISPAAPAEDLGWNAFKVRTHGIIQIPPQVLGFVGSMVVPGDLNSIYPKYPNLTGSTYDGSWRFRFRVPASVDNVTIFDGDMDYGDAACTISDTDDRDSTGVPPFSVGALDEGIATTGLPCPGGTGSQTGLPAEDSASVGFRRVPLGGKGILYRVVAPDGQIFVNRNPSGNREWEQFKILKVAGAAGVACPATGFDGHDCQTTTLPEGVWEIQIDGMDLWNLNFLFLNFNIEK